MGGFRGHGRCDSCRKLNSSGKAEAANDREAAQFSSVEGECPMGQKAWASMLVRAQLGSGSQPGRTAEGRKLKSEYIMGEEEGILISAVWASLSWRYGERCGGPSWMLSGGGDESMGEPSLSLASSVSAVDSWATWLLSCTIWSMSLPKMALKLSASLMALADGEWRSEV